MWTEFQSDSTQFIHIQLYLIELNLNQSNQKWYSINDYFRSKIYRNVRAQDRIHIILNWLNWITFKSIQSKMEDFKIWSICPKIEQDRIHNILNWIVLKSMKYNSINYFRILYSVTEEGRIGQDRPGSARIDFTEDAGGRPCQ